MMLDQKLMQQALFSGLVFNERGEPAEVAYIAGVAHYAIMDDGFRRHVEATKIDSTVIAQLKEQIVSNQDEVTQGIMSMLGKDDLFTKVAIDASIRNMEQNIRQSDPSQWGPWLRLFGFRIIVDIHGEVLQIVYPTQPDDEGGPE